MRRHILLVNYIEGSIPDLNKSKFFIDMDFQSIDSARQLDFPKSKKSPDIVIIFLQKEKPDCLNKIAYITKTNLDKEIIAALPMDMVDTGVKTLQNGASDFFFTAVHSPDAGFLHQPVPGTQLPASAYLLQ